MSDPFSISCGCCAGLDGETPSRIDNPPGQSAIGYRVGTHSSFKESLLAGLSSSRLPTLQGLTTRDDADFTIALCDALATSLEVLTFYQERIANENLLRTATERRSILELARLIGYQPTPGLAASTWLAFTLQEAPGTPALSAGPVVIPVGTRVQSVPGPGEEPQTFETVEVVEARVGWNAMPVQSSTAWKPAVGDMALWLEGIETRVEPGDVILIVGREGNLTRREIRLISEVMVEGPDPAGNRTRLAWRTPLAHAPTLGVEVFVFRQRSPLFGHNAPDPRLIFNANNPAAEGILNDDGSEWAGYQNQYGQIDLDAAYPKILPGSWIALTIGDGFLPRYLSLNQAISFSGASVNTGDQGDYVTIGNSTSRLLSQNGTVDLVFSGFLFEYATGPSQMALDVQVVVDSQPQVPQRFPRGGPHTLSISLPGLAAGLHVIEIQVRSVLLNGPPVNTSLMGTAFLGASGSGYLDSCCIFRSRDVSFLSRRDFGMGGKITRIASETMDGIAALASFPLRETVVLAQSEPLTVAPRPLDYPLFGSELSLPHGTPPITPGRWLAISGRRARIRLRRGSSPQPLVAPDNNPLGDLVEDGSLMLTGPPERNGTVPSPAEFGLALIPPANEQLNLRVLDPLGREASLNVNASAIELVPAAEEDPVVQEIVRIREALAPGSAADPWIRFSLHSALQHCYDRATVTVNANVAPATQGETVSNEILGSGDARVPDARLPLRQAPLTFLSATSPSGRASSLELRVNDLLWLEVSSLFGQGPTDRVYALATDDRGRTTLQFGNGIEGARLPSGDHNVRATYRKGLGRGGNLPAGRLTTLLSRPLGVSGVHHPVPAEGGQDPEPRDRARINAPLTVRTLDRVVSVRDYRDFARGFAGIAKAHAAWIPVGPARGVYLTVAGEAGASVSDAISRKLLRALHEFGDPLMPLQLVSHRAITFRLRLLVKVAPDAEQVLVLPAVVAALRNAYGFEQRDFGQGVSIDQVAAIAQAVPGVAAVHVAALYPSPPASGAPAPSLEPRLFAALPQASLTEVPEPAALLTLDPAPLVLEELP